LADEARTKSAERYLRYALFAGIGLGAVLRFVSLAGKSLWVDELLTIVNAHLGEPGIFSYVLHNLQGPAVSLFIHFWARLGTTETLLRLPFAVVGVLAIPAMYALAREMSDGWTSLHTAFLLALSPVHIWYSQEVRGYAFVVLFSILSTCFFFKWVRKGNRSDIALYAVSVFAGLVSNLSMAFVVGAHLVFLIVRRRQARIALWWAVAVCLVLVAFSPWVGEIVARVQPQRVVGGDTGPPLIGGASLSAMAVPYAFFTFGAGYTFGPSPRDLQVDRRGSIRRNLPAIVFAAFALGVPLLVGLAAAAGGDKDVFTLLLACLIVPALAVAIVSAGTRRPAGIRDAARHGHRETYGDALRRSCSAPRRTRRPVACQLLRKPALRQGRPEGGGEGHRAGLP